MLPCAASRPRTSIPLVRPFSTLATMLKLQHPHNIGYDTFPAPAVAIKAPRQHSFHRIKILTGPQGPQLQKVLERLTGQFTVPNVFIGGKHIGGCTDTVKLYRNGELTSMLSELNIGSTNLQQP